MTRKLRKADWEERCKMLADARAHIVQAREDEGRRHVLHMAMWLVWQFGEFAIDTCLELEGEEADGHHQQHERAADLFTRGVLKKDYCEVLKRQEECRLRAEHGVYSKGGASVHYSPRDVENCLAQMEQLRDEVEALLRERKRL